MLNYPSGASIRVREALKTVSRGLIERESLIEAIVLAAVAGEHLLVIGPPGTAKSEAVRRVALATGSRYFEYLLGRFTEPSEIFGPIDLRRLKEGVVETEVTGMLPEAEIAFLDEIFLGSTAILNTLLGILNERVFRRGSTRIDCLLRVCVGASNSLPQDESLAAFADRFLVRVFVEPIPDPQIEDLLEGGWHLASHTSGDTTSLSDLDALHDAARQVDLTHVRPVLAHAVRILRRNGVMLSDRRIVKAQKLLAAAAALAERTTATEADLWTLVLTVPTLDEQTLAREALRDLLAAADNNTLSAAAEAVSIGPLARARRIVNSAQSLLADQSPNQDVAEREAWLLKLEGVAREIDAGFALDTMPAELSEVREQIVRALQSQQDASLVGSRVAAQPEGAVG